MTKKEYEKRILEMYGTNFNLVSESDEIKNRDNIQIKCNKCNDIFDINARTFIRQDKGLTECKNCKKNKKDELEQERLEKSKNWFLTKEKVEESIIKNLKVIDIKDNSSITVKCTECNNSYITSYANLKKTKSCRYCSNRSKLTLDDYQKRLDEVYPDEYHVLDQVQNEYSYYSKNRPVVLHKSCNHTTTKDINEILKYGCSYCGQTSKNLYEDLVQRVLRKTKGQYKILTKKEDYINMKEPVEILHSKCGTKWNVTLDNFLNGETRCPKCSLKGPSKSVIKILKILNKNKVYFKREARFFQTGDKRFDIHALKINLIIEYDGEQHFKVIRNEEAFLRTTKNDQLKNQFCKKINKNLIRIPYNFDLDKLEDLLSDLKLNNILSFPEVYFIKDGKEFHKEAYYAPVKQELINLNQEDLID